MIISALRFVHQSEYIDADVFQGPSGGKVFKCLWLDGCPRYFIHAGNFPKSYILYFTFSANKTICAWYGTSYDFLGGLKMPDSLKYGSSVLLTST